MIWRYGVVTGFARIEMRGRAEGKYTGTKIGGFQNHCKVNREARLKLGVWRSMAGG